MDLDDRSKMKDGGSPWRIKVTVEAEPSTHTKDTKDKTGTSDKEGSRSRSGSPSKGRRKGRGMTVPMNGGEGASDGVGKSVYMDGTSVGDVEVEGEVVKVQRARKRKGTPIRRQRSMRTQPANNEPTAGEDGDDAVTMPPPTSSATKARRRRSLKELPAGTQRTKRLSLAREELDFALQDAVGHSIEDDGVDVDDVDYGGAGDMTIAGEEDFTMVSVETLQSLKGDTSMMSHRPGQERDHSRLSVSYLPSSPPRPAPGGEEEVENEEVEAQYPDLSARANEARNTPAAKTAETAKTYDTMSWKPTGLAKAASPPPSLSREDEFLVWRRAREAVGRRVENVEPSQVVAVEEDAVVGCFEDGYRLTMPCL